jgi:hypothetical protein
MAAVQQMLLAGRGDTLQLSNQNLTDTGVGTPAFIDYDLTSGGAVTFSSLNIGSGSLEQNVDPATSAGGYSIRAHVNSGTTPTGSVMDSDLALSSTRSWSLSQGAVGTTTCNLTMTLKRISDGATMATATVVLTATRV